jgi:hypothetical protein
LPIICFPGPLRPLPFWLGASGVYYGAGSRFAWRATDGERPVIVRHARFLRKEIQTLLAIDNQQKIFCTALRALGIDDCGYDVAEGQPGYDVAEGQPVCQLLDRLKAKRVYRFGKSLEHSAYSSSSSLAVIASMLPVAARRDACRNALQHRRKRPVVGGTLMGI